MHLSNFPIQYIYKKYVALKNITLYFFFLLLIALSIHFQSYRCPPLLQRYKFKVTISVTNVPPPSSLQFILAFKKIYSTLLSFFKLIFIYCNVFSILNLCCLTVTSRVCCHLWLMCSEFLITGIYT